MLRGAVGSVHFPDPLPTMEDEANYFAEQVDDDDEVVFTFHSPAASPVIAEEDLEELNALISAPFDHVPVAEANEDVPVAPVVVVEPEVAPYEIYAQCELGHVTAPGEDMSCKRGWFFTYHGEFLWWEFPEVQAKLHALAVQREVSGQGNIHYQGFFILDPKNRFGWIKRHINNKMYIVAMASRKASCHYVRKPHDGCNCVACETERENRLRVPGFVPYQFGYGPWNEDDDDDEPKKKRRGLVTYAELKSGAVTREELEKMPCYISHFNTYSKILVELAPERSFSDKLCVIVLHGESGVCKSHFYTFLREPYNTVWHAPGTNSGDFICNGYDGSPTVEFGDNKYILENATHFLSLCDRVTKAVNVKGSSALWRPKIIYITTNVPKELWFDKMFTPGAPISHLSPVAQAVHRRINFEMYCDRGMHEDFEHDYTYQGNKENWTRYYKPKFEKLAKDVISYLED